MIDQVKAYKPDHLVTADDVRDLIGVLHGDGASKGFLTTTSDFAPRLRIDPLITPFVPSRLEMIDGKALLASLEELAAKRPVTGMPFHTTAAEHFDKLKRVCSRLDAEVHKDDLDDFFKTAYHLIEITQKCSTTTTAQKGQATALRSDPEMELCREIVNRQKHYALSPRSHPSPAIRNATIRKGYGIGRYGAGGYGVGEQSATLNFTDGTQRDARDLCNSIFKKFAHIFP